VSEGNQEGLRFWACPIPAVHHRQYRPRRSKLGKWHPSCKFRSVAWTNTWNGPPSERYTFGLRGPGT
jgi:hypothetical protein